MNFLNRKVISFTLSIALLISSCKKTSDADQGSNPDPSPNPPPVQTTASKKFLVDTTTSKLVSSSQDLENGLFKYDLLPGTDSLKKGDFFIEPRDSVYLRKIETITKSNNQVTISTTATSLSEFYKDSGLVKRNFSIPALENPLARKSGSNDKVQMDFPAVTLTGDGWNLALENLVFSFDPQFALEYDVKNSYLKAGIVNAQTKVAYDVTLTSEIKGKAEKEFKLSSIAPNLVKMVKIRIPNLFLQVHLLDVIVKVTVEGGGSVSQKWSYKSAYTSNAFIEYKNSVLSGNLTNENTLHQYDRSMSITGGVNAKVELYPIFRIRELGMSIVNIGIKGIFENDVKHSLVSDTWDLKSEVYGGFFGNFNRTAFQFIAPEEYIIKTPSYILVEAPKTLKHIAGGNESTLVNTPLKNPIEFQVFEKNNLRSPDPEAGVNVFFSSNYGKWASQKVRTDANGKVKNEFTMGPEDKEHILTATIKNAANEVIDTKTIKLTPAACNLAVNVVSNGLIATASASGGTPPYTYSWNNGAVTGAIFSDRSSKRNVQVTVKDANGCTVSRNDICVGVAGNLVASPCTNQSFNFYLDGNLVGTLNPSQTMNVIFSGSHGQQMVGTITGVTHNYTVSISPGQNCVQWTTCCPDAGTCTTNLCQ